jgi:hypothetical protein
MAQDAPRATEVKYYGRVRGIRPSPMLRAPTHGTVIGSPDQSLNVHGVFKSVWYTSTPLFFLVLESIAVSVPPAAQIKIETRMKRRVQRAPLGPDLMT